jgi:hypothetical protein
MYTFQNVLKVSIMLGVMLVIGCKTATEPENNAPIISGVVVNPPTVAANGTATVNVTATDTDGDALTYAYAPNGGAISGAGAAVIWTAPGNAGAYSVAITVTDGQGGQATGSGNLTVTPAAVVTRVTGRASFPAGVNSNLNNAQVALYTSIANWNAYSPIKFVAIMESGANVSYTINDINPGNYYLDVWKDNDNNNVWSVGDFVGWYGSGALAAPALTEFQIAAGQTITINVNMAVI